MLLGACGFEPPSVQLVCGTRADCPDGECVSGRCVATDAGPDVRSDAGDVSTGDGSVDGGPDAVLDGGPDVGDCVVDADDDGFFVGSDCPEERLDCDDGDGDVYPGAEQRCNGRDNDCDGVVDSAGCVCFDGDVAACGSDEGVCEAGQKVCVEGAWGACEGGVGSGVEVCDGLDNDCNGVVDEACPCMPGQTRSCGVSEGVCMVGTQACDAGVWGDCEGAVGPSDELCDGLDNDCDGTVDEESVDAGAACNTGLEGRCALGSLTCVNASLVCLSVNGPVAETCNGVDDNCAGGVDEDVTQACTTACGAGVQACVAGVFDACEPLSPPEEICDGTDNDCDGLVDESFPEAGLGCETGLLGVCGVGAQACTPEGLRCEPAVGPSAEVCDGLDNDCDGLVDEDASGLVLTEQCGTTCPNRSVRLCLNGSWTACNRGEAEVCNQEDSNCDGLVDNTNVCYRACAGGGVATGTLNCGTGACALPAEICGDGLDNDCDGVVDQGCVSSVEDMVYVPGGTFVMGSLAADVTAAADEQPQHLVSLSPFYIDRYEVTRGEYTACFLAGRCSGLSLACPFQNPANPDRPVLCVSHGQAQDYCAWRGGRLPTEAEWEKAARGPFPRRPIWPWGDQADVNRGVFECTALNGPSCVQDVDSLVSGRSYYSIHHLAGNAAEWVDDFYDADFYGPNLVVNPRQTADQGLGHVIRGGSYRQELQYGRTANRAANLDLPEVGFRCVKDSP